MQSNLVKKIITFTLAGVLTVAPVAAVNANQGSLAATSYEDGYNSGTVSGPSASTNSGSNTTEAPAVDVNKSEVTLADGTVLTTTTPGAYTATVVEGAAVTTPAPAVNAALGVAAGEAPFVMVANSQCGPKAQACVNAAAEALNVTVGPALDIFAGKIAAGKYTAVDKAAAPVQFTFGTPKHFAQAGYDIAVIRVQLGGIVTVLPDLDNDPNTVTISTDGFGVFAFVKAPAGSFDAFKTVQ